MKLRIAIGSTLVAGALALPAASFAQQRVEIEVNTPPPPPPTVNVEVKPSPRPGHVYVPGHYEYESSKYVWKDPDYLPEKQGYKYEFSTIEKKGDKWVYRSGEWVQK
jgi:hypothetical protein